MIQQIENAGLNVAKTLDALKEQAEKINIDFDAVNYLDINKYPNEGKCSIWMINYDKNGDRQYNYFNDSKAVEVKYYPISTKKYLYNLLKNNRARMGEGLIINNGYLLSETTDNKPTTLEQIKEHFKKEFVCFVAWDGFQFRTFTIQGKKTFNYRLCWMDGINYTYNLGEANETRKKAKNIFVLLHKDAENLTAPRVLHYKRKDNRKETNNTRYNIKDVFCYNCENVRPVYTSIQTADGWKYTKVSFCGYSLPLPMEFNDMNKTQQNEYIFNNCFDKSGYFILGNRERIKRATEQVKRSKDRQEWETCDKSGIVNQIESIKVILLDRYNYLLKQDLFNKPHLVQHLTALKELYNTFDNFKIKFDNYQSKKEFEKYFKPYLEKLQIELIITNYKNIDNISLGTYGDYLFKDGVIVNRYDWRNLATPTL